MSTYERTGRQAGIVCTAVLALPVCLVAAAALGRTTPLRALPPPFARMPDAIPVTTQAEPAHCGSIIAADAMIDASSRRAVQGALKRMGFYTGGIDGIFGPLTRAAIRRWQHGVGCTPTGYLTWKQYGALRRDPYRESGPRPPVGRGTTTTKKAKPPMPAKIPKQPAPTATPKDNSAVERAKAEESALKLTSGDRKRVEHLLADLGMNPGKTDGIFDADTRAAILLAQTRWGFPRTGYLDEVTFVKMLSLGIFR